MACTGTADARRCCEHLGGTVDRWQEPLKRNASRVAGFDRPRSHGGRVHSFRGWRSSWVHGDGRVRGSGHVPRDGCDVPDGKVRVHAENHSEHVKLHHSELQHHL